MGEKLIAHMHQQIMHLEVVNTTANKQNEWWIPRKRSKVKVINQCNNVRYSAQHPMYQQQQLRFQIFRQKMGGHLRQLVYFSKLE